jgi:hypothetical protein
MSTHAIAALCAVRCSCSQSDDSRNYKENVTIVAQITTTFLEMASGYVRFHVGKALAFAAARSVDFVYFLRCVEALTSDR